MFRLKQLAKCSKIKTDKLIARVTLKHRRKYYCYYDEIWYQFKSINQLIIPYIWATRAFGKVSPKLYIPVENTQKITVDPLPLIAILGHFNHGKTTLLDRLCNTTIVDEEVLNTTQVIRSRLTSLRDSSLVTLIDTPGQDIFYRIRNLGGDIADLIILVIAANDGICEQTMESIGIIETLDLPVIVCINKIDLYPATEQEKRILEIEKEGKEFVALRNAQFIPISAKENINIDKLQAMIAQTLNMISNKKPKLLEEVADIDRRLLSIEHVVSAGIVLNTWISRQDGNKLH
eukprot:gene13989-18759_t